MEWGALLSLQGMMFLLMLIGMMFKKKGIISNDGKRLMTDLVIMLTLPASIVKAFLTRTDPEILRNCLVSFVAAVGVEIFSLVLGRILFCRKSGDRRTTMQYGTLCSNAGILGSTVAEGLYSDLGLLYASVSLIPFRIFLWTVGLLCFTKAPSKKEVAKKVLTHPCIIAVFLGVILMISGISFPSPVTRTIVALANANTAMATMMVGTSLADVNWKNVLNGDLFLLSFTRLFLVPAGVLVIGRFAGLTDTLLGIPVILTAMPIASTAAVLAAKYEVDTEFATGAVVFTTLCSLVTAPVWGWFLSLIG